MNQASALELDLLVITKAIHGLAIQEEEDTTMPTIVVVLHGIKIQTVVTIRLCA
jgi:hypothetical protein